MLRTFVLQTSHEATLREHCGDSHARGERDREADMTKKKLRAKKNFV